MSTKSHQQADGSWRDVGRKVHTQYQGTDGKHVGVTALACMAFLANGSLPGRGKYGEQIERGLEFILAHVEPNGYITNESSRMYSHAFATLFLAEIYGMTGMERVEDGLKSAINLIVHAQNPQGGWRYQPGAPDADMSITVCQVMALRAAQNAGVHVPKRTIDDAIRYVNNSYRVEEGGGFTYQIDDGMQSRVTLALTAAGVTALYGAGVYDDSRIENGLEYIQRNLPAFTRNHGGPRQRRLLLWDLLRDASGVSARRRLLGALSETSVGRFAAAARRAHNGRLSAQIMRPRSRVSFQFHELADL